MTSNDIYTILSSKPHNVHYLKRYLNFILACQESNKEITGYTENHHICPKADDLFPEYKNLKEFQWNSISLSARQHFIAHMILWKAYGGSQSYAFKRFCDGSSTDKTKRETKYKISSKSYEILKLSAIAYTSEFLRGTVTYRNIKTGESGRISKEEFDSNDNLVGSSYMKRGWKNAEEGRRNKSKPKSKEHAEKTANVLRSRKPIICCIITRKEFICTAWAKHEKIMYETGYKEQLGKKYSEALTGVTKTQKHKDALSSAKQEKNKINRICAIDTKVEMTTQQFLRKQTIEKEQAGLGCKPGTVLHITTRKSYDSANWARFGSKVPV